MQNKRRLYVSLVAKDYVGKATYQETVRAIENKFEAVTNPQNGSIATQIANYKTAVDGRFADISSLLSGKANQMDFQRVKETSQLYERILGTSETGAPDKLSRLVMSSEIFQTEVGKYVTDDNNLIVNSMTMDKNTLVGNNNPKASVSVADGILQSRRRALLDITGLGLHPDLCKKIYHGETYTLGFKYRIKEYPDSAFAFNIKNHGLNKTLLSSDIGKERPALNEWQEFQKLYRPRRFRFW